MVISYRAIQEKYLKYEYENYYVNPENFVVYHISTITTLVTIITNKGIGSVKSQFTLLEMLFNTFR